MRDYGIGHVRYRTNEDSPDQPYKYKDSWLAFNGEVVGGDTRWLAQCLYHGGRVDGAFSFLWMQGEKIIAGRDPRGFHPLYYAHTVYGVVAASETTADPTLFWHEVKPGTYVDLSNGKSEHFYARCPAKCCFEDVYFRTEERIR